MLTRHEYNRERLRAYEVIAATGFPLNTEDREHTVAADFGLSNLPAEGAQILTFFNTERISGKLIELLPGQTLPEHWHPPVPDSQGTDPGKEETLRVVAGTLYYVDDAPPATATSATATTATSPTAATGTSPTAATATSPTAAAADVAAASMAPAAAPHAAAAAAAADQPGTARTSGKTAAMEQTLPARIPAGKAHAYTCRNVHVMNRGDQVTIAPGRKHWLQGGPAGCVVFSFSTCVRDVLDRFSDPAIERVTRIVD
jgi:D-lyxose ketol-isomerase